MKLSASLNKIKSGKIIWLHLSDIHLKSSGNTYLSNKIIESLSETLREMQLKPEFIFFTGDLSSDGIDYKDSEKFLNDILNACGLSDSKRRLFIVPGNHDVDRTKCEFFNRPLKTQRDSEKFFGENQTRELFFKRFGKFSDFYNDYFKDIRKYNNEKPFIAEVIPIKIDDNNLIKIGIIGLNSAWFSQGKDDMGTQWIGESLCNKAFQEIENDDCDLIIVLQHHPISWLHHKEIKNIELIYRKKANILLTGHIHENDAEFSKKQNGDLIILQAGAINKDFGDSFDYRALIGSIDFESKGIEIRAIKYIEESNKWLMDKSFGKMCIDFLDTSQNRNNLDQKIDIPIVVYAMTSREAKELEALLESNYPKDLDNLNLILDKLNIKNLEKYYSDRDKWEPYSDNTSIKQILSNLIFESNDSIRPRFVTEDFFDEKFHLWEYIRNCGGIIVIDAVSLFHPVIRNKLRNSGVIYSEKAAVFILNQTSPSNSEINRIIEDFLHIEGLARISEKFKNDYLSLFEMGIDNQIELKRRIAPIIQIELENIENCNRENNKFNLRMHMNSVGKVSNDINEIFM